jgi:3D-(3,5/4)-trihydroxycyclohexane-1,2-dione acylhydrolase (decyclizing)
MSVEVQSESSASAREATVRLTAAQAIVRFLQAQQSERDGVRRRVIPALFAIYGHGNVCGLGQAVDELGADLAFFQPKNEQAMVHTAIGYAKASDRLATLACTASVGPGATNMVTGAATATVNRIPVLLLPADTFANRRQGPVMQALDHRMQGDWSVNDCFRPVSAFFDRIARPEQLLSALPQAMRVLLDPIETGAVTLALHQDVQGEAYDFPQAFFEPRVWHVARRPPAAEEIAAAADLIRGARRPFLIAGGGIHYSRAEHELRVFAERHNVPVGETPAGKGAAGDSPLGLGGVGRTGTHAANTLAADADVVICAGTRLVDGTTASHSLFQDPDVRFVGINVASVDAFKLGAVPVVADARVALAELSAALGDWAADETWTERAATAWAQWQGDLTADLAPREGERMSQGQVLAALNDATTPQDVLVVASGTPHGDVQKLWDAGRGARVLLEVGFSCMGHEIPAALGVRIAQPDVPPEVYVVIGDGTYLMGASELATAAQEGLKITTIVIENHGFQSIHSLQRRKTATSYGLEFRRREGDGLTGPYAQIDYAANARSFGCTAYRAETLEQFSAALAEAREQSGPCVIVAAVEPLRMLLPSNCWWDVGVAEVSARPEMQAIAEEHRRGRQLQRFYG